MAKRKNKAWDIQLGSGLTGKIIHVTAKTFGSAVHRAVKHFNALYRTEPPRFRKVNKLKVQLPPAYFALRTVAGGGWANVYDVTNREAT